MDVLSKILSLSAVMNIFPKEKLEGFTVTVSDVMQPFRSEIDTLYVPGQSPVSE